MGELAAAFDPLTGGHGRAAIMGALAAVEAPESLATGSEMLYAARRQAS